MTEKILFVCACVVVRNTVCFLSCLVFPGLSISSSCAHVKVGNVSINRREEIYNHRINKNIHLTGLHDHANTCGRLHMQICSVT